MVNNVTNHWDAILAAIASINLLNSILNLSYDNNSLGVDDCAC